jgi:hypothetical protein
MLPTTPVSVHEQRRYPRIRFDTLLPIRVGHQGQLVSGGLENLSLGGLMFRADIDLMVGETIGVEFRVFDSPVIDMPVSIASRVGKGLYGARFNAGPISNLLIESAIEGAIRKGKASIITIHDREDGKQMRIVGGLTVTAKNEFMHGLSRAGIAELDLSEVTRIDAEGVALCSLAVSRYGVRIGQRSLCVEEALPR